MYSIPFYQLYPDLLCTMNNGTVIKCDHKVACEASLTKSYEIDWSAENSVSNWMTDLDLICAKPYSIGLIGFVTFVSFSVGSAIITKITDKKGRK